MGIADSIGRLLRPQKLTKGRLCVRNKTTTTAKTTTTVGQLHSFWALIFGGWAGEEALIAHKKTRHVHFSFLLPFSRGVGVMRPKR